LNAGELVKDLDWPVRLRLTDRDSELAPWRARLILCYLARPW